MQVHYKWHGDVDATLRGMPRHLTVERAIVGFLDLFADIVHVAEINSYTFSFLAHLLHSFGMLGFDWS